MSEAQTAQQNPAPPAAPPGYGPPVPRAVRAAAEAANAAIERARQAAQPQPFAPEAQPQQPGIQMLQPQPEGEGQQQGQQPGDAQHNQPAQNEGQPASSPAAREGTGTPAPQGGEDWEHRYRSDKGRWDSERARLVGRMEALEGLLANLNSQPAPQQQQAPAEQQRPREAAFAPPEDMRLSEQDRRDYGDDMISVIRKVATEVAYDVAARVRAEVQEVAGRVGSVQSTVQSSVQERFWGGLRAAVPDLDTMNQDEGFLAWLAQRDPYSGEARQTLLNRAVEAGSAERAAAFFNGYKREAGLAAPQAGQPPAARQPAAGQGQQPATRATVPLEQLAAPGRVKSGPGSNGSQAQAPVYTRAQVAEFFEDVRRGKFPGTPEQRAWTEADIARASAEGRIR